MSIGSMYCQRCGTGLAESDTVCTACGTPREAPVAADPPANDTAFDFGTMDDDEIDYGSNRPHARDFDPEAVIRWVKGRVGAVGERRPAPNVARWISAAGGTLLGLGAVEVAGALVTDEGEGGTAAFVTALCLAAVVGALATFPARLLSATVAAANTLALAVGVFLSMTGGENAGVLGAFVVAAVLIGLYLFGPSRGHTSHLALFLVALVVGGLILAAKDAFNSLDYAGFTTSAIVLLFVLGGIYLALGEWLDRYGLKGVATAFLGVGVVALSAGVSVWISKSGGWAGAAGIVVAVAVLFVASDRRRRGLLWIGAIGLVFAALVLVAEFESDSNEVAIGLVLLLVGAGIAGFGERAAEILDNLRRDDRTVEMN